MSASCALSSAKPGFVTICDAISSYVLPQTVPIQRPPQAAYVYERNASKPSAAEGICQDARHLRNMHAVPALHGAMKSHEGRGARLEKVFVQLCVTIVRGNTPSPSDHKEAKAKPSSPTFDLGMMARRTTSFVKDRPGSKAQKTRHSFIF